MITQLDILERTFIKQMTFAIFKKIHFNSEKSNFESCEKIQNKRRFQCFSLSPSQDLTLVVCIISTLRIASDISCKKIKMHVGNS